MGEIVPELKNLVIIEDAQADVPTYRTATNPILLHQLLSHTSGLAYTLEKRGANYLTSQYTDEAYGGGDVTEEKFLELLKVSSYRGPFIDIENSWLRETIRRSL